MPLGNYGKMSSSFPKAGRVTQSGKANGGNPTDTSFDTSTKMPMKMKGKGRQEGKLSVPTTKMPKNGFGSGGGQAVAPKTR